MARSDWTKAEIRELLDRNPRSVERAMLVLFARQTRGEQSSGATVERNNRGFSAFHAKAGSYYAAWVKSGRRLTGQHLDRARKIARHYAGQLVDEANSREKREVQAKLDAINALIRTPPSVTFTPHRLRGPEEDED